MLSSVSVFLFLSTYISIHSFEFIVSSNEPIKISNAIRNLDVKLNYDEEVDTVIGSEIPTGNPTRIPLVETISPTITTLDDDVEYLNDSENPTTTPTMLISESLFPTVKLLDDDIDDFTSYENPTGMPTSAPSAEPSDESDRYYYYYASPTSRPTSTAKVPIPTVSHTISPSLHPSHHKSFHPTLAPLQIESLNPSHLPSISAEAATPSPVSSAHPTHHAKLSHPSIVPTVTPTLIENSLQPVSSSKNTQDTSFWPTGPTYPPTPSGLLGEEWWYLTIFRCIIWGEAPPSALHRSAHMILAVSDAVLFVLRDRMTPASDQEDGGGGGLLPTVPAIFSHTDGIWVEATLPTESSERVVTGARNGSDDDANSPAVGTRLFVRVWTSAEESLPKVASILREINHEPDILVEALHERALRSVTTTEILLLNSTTTTEPPPYLPGGAIYEEASRIGWIILGTVGVFGLLIGLLVCVRLCCGKDGVIYKALSTPGNALSSISTNGSDARGGGGWGNVFRSGDYRQFRSTPIRDLDSFHLDDDEVTIELQEIA